MNGTATATSNPNLLNASLLLMRVIVGTVFVVHGAAKLDSNVLGMMTSAMGPLAYLVLIGELLGGIGMIVGFLTRFSAAANTVIMIGAIAMVHGKNGFLMQNSGYEYNLALIGLLVPLVLLGPGRWAVGRFLPLPKQPGSDRPILPLE